MGKSITNPGAERTKRPRRTVEVYDTVYVVLAGLSPVEQETIRAALRSAASIRRLPVTLVVQPEDGEKMYTARVTDDMRLVYTIEPERLTVVLLMSAEAITAWRRAFGHSDEPTP